ncbi:hypothetical protein LINGRAHAP2_LOCUS8452 [Linum grandiflorum]
MVFSRRNLAAIAEVMLITIFLVDGQFDCSFVTADKVTAVPPCIPNTITDDNLAASIAKVNGYLLHNTPSHPEFLLRTHAVTDGVMAYGYAYCYLPGEDCTYCLNGLLYYVKRNCENAPTAKVMSMYCFLKYSPNPV